MYSVYFRNNYIGVMSLNNSKPLEYFLEANPEYRILQSQLFFNKI